MFNSNNHNVDLKRLDEQQKYIWNAAIEMAALKLETDFDFLGEELLAAQEIRKLKK
jgi:hypothetical protein